MNIKKWLMAFLTPLALIACSEVDSLVPNAPSGEPYGLSSSSDEAPASSSSVVFDGSDVVYRGMNVYTAPYGSVQIYELDSVTFDTTRRVPYSWNFSSKPLYLVTPDIDSIVIDSLSLKSPYVMLSTDYSNRRYNIVDVRDANAFAVDKKTYFESIRARYLMKSGMSFAEAKKQASKEVLESFGFYVDLFDKPEVENVQDPSYRIYMAFIEDFMKYTTEDTVVAKLEKCGNLTCGTEFLKKRFLTESLNMLKELSEILTYAESVEEQDQYAVLSVEKARRNLLFLKSFVAHLLDAGLCTAENEGKAFEILDKNIMLTCRSEGWEFSYKEMKHSMGTMTDERDGKTYKTVTYDINGKTQTWLAERLDYNASELQVPCEHRASCCGMYDVGGAFSLDTSIIETREMCFQRHLKDCPECEESDFWNECEEGLERSLDTLKYRQHMDSVMVEKGVYQGVCPNGWHIPTRGEMDSLLDYMVEWYNPTVPKKHENIDRKGLVGDYLHRTFLGNPTGFGLTLDEYDFYVVDEYNRACSAVDRYSCYGDEFPSMAESYVRCIKD
ncbi:FISUMP domain-containing protein [Fibrobacter sp. UWB11]|uniref:FISUMP domain-containing protein n=1 Tax=Fibrobacter sp. UWB11 TaxID=1896202 RepID=UPI000925D1EA|nr:FISUMP domain-containing protein [Fibrobacter sp. UWB11]SIO39012.1 major paralogous domain-containing protein [Fibrobacter sp. UWB11]